MNKKLLGSRAQTKNSTAISNLLKARKYKTSDAELVRMKDMGRN